MKFIEIILTDLKIRKYESLWNLDQIHVDIWRCIELPAKIHWDIIDII